MNANRSRPKAEFIKPLNMLRSKVGYGGLNDNILNEAQMLIEYRAGEFPSQAAIYLDDLKQAIERGQHEAPGMDRKMLITAMLDPAMHLKANGGMFNYPLLTSVGARLIEFVDEITDLNGDAVDVVSAFHGVMETVLAARLTGSGNKRVEKMIKELEAACHRYFERYPGKRPRV